jgi:urease accessory protein
VTAVPLTEPADTPQPRQQRSAGHGRLSAFAGRDGKTRLARLYQEGSAKIRVPRDGDRVALEAVLINTSGGLTGGDRLEWEIEAQPGSRLTLTTQACEKVYRSSGGEALVTARITAGTGARVAWLPQESILFDGGRLARRFDVQLAADAELLAIEAVILGRRAHGETVEHGLFRDRWRVRRDGRLLHAEETRLEQPFERFRGKSAALGGCTAFATILLVSDAAAGLADAASGCISEIGTAGGASAWTVAGSGKLLARLAARDGYELRKALGPLLRLLNADAEGDPGLPRIWSI